VRRHPRHRNHVRTGLLPVVTIESPCCSHRRWCTDDYRIFVGDLGNEVTDETLTQAFKQFRSFNKAKIIRERWNNKTKGYGFVSFADSADMVACMKSMNGEPTYLLA
jgi:hypothetical protein